jgi:hypothetical protein
MTKKLPVLMLQYLLEFPQKIVNQGKVKVEKCHDAAQFYF